MNSHSRLVKISIAMLLAIVTWSVTASAGTLTVYRARATLVGYLETMTGTAQTLSVIRFNSPQLTNLALGNKLADKIPTGVELAIAADYAGGVAGDPSSEKQLIVIDSTNTQVLSTLVVSDTASVYNAQSTYHGFKRLGFGAGIVQTTGNTQFGTTGGRVQLLGVLHKVDTRLHGPEPILTLSMVGSMDVNLAGVSRTFYIVSGVITASGAPLGQISD